MFFAKIFVRSGYIDNFQSAVGAVVENEQFLSKTLPYIIQWQGSSQFWKKCNKNRHSERIVLTAVNHKQTLQLPHQPRSWALKILSVITPGRNGVESQWKYPWMRKTARNPMKFPKKYLYIWNLRKIHTCEFTVLNFSQFSEKIKKIISSIPLAFQFRFLCFQESEMHIWTFKDRD